MLDEARTSRYIHQYLVAFSRWFWLAALCIVVGTAGTFAMTTIQTPVYRATTILFVGQQSANVPLVDIQLVTTYEQLITQPAVIAAAADQVGGISPTELAGHVQTAIESNTSLIDVSVDDPNPQRAAELSNAVAAAFISKISSQVITAAYPVVVFQAGVPPAAPDHPKLLLNTLIGGAFGLVIALVLVQLLDVVDTRMRAARPVENKIYLNNHGIDDLKNLTDIVVGETNGSAGECQQC